TVCLSDDPDLCAVSQVVRRQQAGAVLQGLFVCFTIFRVEIAPIATNVAVDEVRWNFNVAGECVERTGCRDGSTKRKTRRCHLNYSADSSDQEVLAFRKVPRLAVALNLGIRSSSSKDEVKALLKLHIVRGRNSSKRGLK